MNLSNREDLRRLNAEILLALEPLFRREGFQGKILSGSFEPDGSSILYRLQISVEGHDPSAKAFSQMADLFGLKAENLGAKITIAGEAFEIVGLKPNSRKFPILLKRLSDGKLFKHQERTVKAALERNGSNG